MFCWVLSDVTKNRAAPPSYHSSNVASTVREKPEPIRTASSDYSTPSAVSYQAPPITFKAPPVTYKAPPVAPSQPVYKQEAPTSFYRDAQGNTYRVSNSDYYRLLAQKTEIESEKRELDRLDSQLDQLNAQLDRDRIYLDRTSQYQVDAYNAKVTRLNWLNQDAQAKLRSHNYKVDAFNSELARVGTLVR